MLEIDEIVPFYLCKGGSSDICVVNMLSCYEDCKHVTIPTFAKNESSVKIFEKFCETFNVVVDDYGRLNCFEKEEEK